MLSADEPMNYDVGAATIVDSTSSRNGNSNLPNDEATDTTTTRGSLLLTDAIELVDRAANDDDVDVDGGGGGGADDEHSDPVGEEEDATTNDNDFIAEPLDEDVICGRGAKVNMRPGNRKFRALCFTRKPEFDEGNLLVKRQVATQIVVACQQANNSRFMKKGADGQWIELSMEQAIQKACQVMRDYKRPDRVALREGREGKRERKHQSTPMDEVVHIPIKPLEPVVENPCGVHDHDILCGRGAFVNGHIGNKRLRELALERKNAFDGGNFTEKQALAAEIVSHIKALDPPGRFLKRIDVSKNTNGLLKGLSGEWEELSDDKAIHKATQVMRDINRPDRLERVSKRKQNKKGSPEEQHDELSGSGASFGEIPAGNQRIAEEGATLDLNETTGTTAGEASQGQLQSYARIELTEDHPGAPDESIMSRSSAVKEAVEATEEVLENALDSRTFQV